MNENQQGPMRMTTDRERDLAQAMHDAVADVVPGYGTDEILSALTALLCEVSEVIENEHDPVEAAQSVINALEANILRH